MKKTFLFAAAALAMLASCSQNDDLNSAPVVAEVENNAITFGTYVGGENSTRAGWAGDITNDKLQSNTHANGFGVFAFYTGTNTYEQTNGTTNTLFPNFMYNEHVYYESSNWKYDNIKYWPNEIQSGNVDKNNATTSHANGGKVSFFAYAPYVDPSGDLGATGITALTGNSAMGDPKVTYVFAKTGKNVDLLWGTYGSTSADVLSGPLNAGVLSNAAIVTPRPITDRATAGWQKDILSDKNTTPTKYRMNADLVKQEIDGKVNFAFKHALSKVGGSEDISGIGSGLQIVLDADDVNAADAATNTVVSVEDIKITTLPMTYLDNTGTAKSGDDARYITGGTFNLATGKWDNIQTSDAPANAIVHELTTSGTDVSGSLNSDIAEPATVENMDIVSSKRTLNGTVKGVTGTAKNVYGSETSPLVFIPGCKPKFEIEITYYVRSFDSKLVNSTPGLTKTGETGTWTNVKQTIKKTIEFNQYTELNKRYSLLIHLGITSVNFTASVSDWDAVDRNGDNNINEEDIDRVDLPLNVN